MIARQLNRAALRDGVRRLGSSTTGTARVWALTVVLSDGRGGARDTRAPGRAAGEGPDHAALVGARGRVLSDRSESRPPSHRPQCALVLDERDPRRLRDLLLRAGRVHRGPSHRGGPGAGHQPASAVGQARLQPRPVPALLGGHRRCRPPARRRHRKFRAARLADGLPGDLRREHGGCVRRDRCDLPGRGRAATRPDPTHAHDGRDRVAHEHQPRAARDHGPVRRAGRGAAVRGADHRGLRRLPRVRLGAPAARRPRDAVRVNPDPPAQPRNGPSPRVPARPCSQDVPGGDRRSLAPAPGRRSGHPADERRAARGGRHDAVNRDHA